MAGRAQLCLLTSRLILAMPAPFFIKDRLKTKIFLLAGQTWFSAGLGARMIQASAKEAPIERLTPRERDILDALAPGLSSKQIAQRTGLSVRTVETHRLNLKRKLEIDGQAELIKFAVENCRK
jgi:two-component system, NarL family, nitrate/nitrite response regulator NarL